MTHRHTSWEDRLVTLESVPARTLSCLSSAVTCWLSVSWSDAVVSLVMDVAVWQIPTPCAQMWHFARWPWLASHQSREQFSGGANLCPTHTPLHHTVAPHAALVRIGRRTHVMDPTCTTHADLSPLLLRRLEGFLQLLDNDSMLD